MIAIVKDGRLVGLADDSQVKAELSRVRRSLGLEDRPRVLRGLAQRPEKWSQGEDYRGYRTAA